MRFRVDIYEIYYIFSYSILSLKISQKETEV